MSGDIIIRHTDTATISPCGICGERELQEEPGPRLFVEGTNNLVCDDCGWDLAAELAWMVEVFYSPAREWMHENAQSIAEEHEKSGNKPFDWARWRKLRAERRERPDTSGE